jgi:yecA family protein
MVLNDSGIKLPDYFEFAHAIAGLSLPISCSELHGVLCGYLAANGQQQGESYLRALLAAKRNSDEARQAALALFDVFTISQQQLAQLGFEFELMLPDDDAVLTVRAQAFSEWCEGFTQGLTLSGIDFDRLPSDEAQNAIQHITEFAQLDYAAVRINEEDEKALLDVIEYTRMAVLSIHADIQAQVQDGRGTTH